MYKGGECVFYASSWLRTLFFCLIFTVLNDLYFCFFFSSFLAQESSTNIADGNIQELLAEPQQQRTDQDQRLLIDSSAFDVVFQRILNGIFVYIMIIK